MFKNLITFGCGWTYGEELLDPELAGIIENTHDSQNDEYRLSHSYGGLLAKHYGLTYKSYAETGYNLDKIFQSVSDWLHAATNDELSKTLLLVGWSDAFPGTLEYENAVTILDNLSKSHAAHLYQFNVVCQQRPSLKLETFIDATSIMEILVIRNKPRSHPLFSPFKYPNEAGHKVIADHLIKKLTPVIIN